MQENALHLPGISDQVDSKRYYPTEVKAPHVFGYMREASREEYLADDRIQLGDKVGKSGIERVYEEYMRGELGVDYIRVNAYRSEERRVGKEGGAWGGKEARTSRE